MVRRRKRSVRIGLVVAACIVAFTAYIVLRAARTSEPARAPKPVPPECRLGPTTPGIDVSYYQGDIAWPRVRRAGVRFTFIRVSDGSEILDTKFEANWRGAQRAGVLRGAYQFFRPEESPIAQANVLIRALRTRGMGDLPPVIDVEVTGGLPLATVAANARVWIEHVRSQLGVEPIVYTNPGMWQWRGAGELARQPLWLAHYTTQCPTLPPPWTRWLFWQYTDTGRIDGIEGPVDLDVFDGTLEELRRRFAP
jgi:lysozyme